MHKRGQISEVISWTVATIVIVTILSLSIFLSINASFGLSISSTILDRALEKSSYAYLLTEEKGVLIYDDISSKDEFGGISEEFAYDLFPKLYFDQYDDGVWAGLKLVQTWKPRFRRSSERFGDAPGISEKSWLTGLFQGKKADIYAESDVMLKDEKKEALFIGVDREKDD
jgi:hypothetical protein